MADTKFRETLWFKQGDLDAARAQRGPADQDSASEAPERAGASLPIEDRYRDDGTVRAEDSAAFGLHTGRTIGMPRVVRGAAAVDDCAEADLVAELKGRRALLGVAAMVALAAAFATLVSLA